QRHFGTGLLAGFLFLRIIIFSPNYDVQKLAIPKYRGPSSRAIMKSWSSARSVYAFAGYRIPVFLIFAFLSQLFP
ncbi:MAG: hypothetical protein ACO3N7_05845, partial [Kiritimatiellia bacterium]